MSLRLRASLLALLLVSSAGAARAQTVTWAGGFPNDQSGTASNWQGGLLPLNDGTETLQFTDQSSGVIRLTSNAFYNSVVVVPANSNSANEFIIGTNSLSIGPGGIYVNGVGETASFLTINTPVVLTASQTWGIGESEGGTLTVNGAVTGAFGLALEGDDDVDTFTLGSASSTFTGGVTMTGNGATLVIGASSAGPAGAPTSGPLGTGTVALGDGTFLTTPTSSLVTLANPVILGDRSGNSTVTLGGIIFNSSPPQTNLTLTGPVTLNDADLEISISGNSLVTFAGNLNGYTSTVCLDFGSTGIGNSIADVQGIVSNVARIDLEDTVSVILDAPSGNLTSGTSQITGVGSIGVGSSTDYLGLGAAYAAAGYVPAFLAYLNSSGSSANFAGTLGFDTTSGSTATFNDPVDLTGFTVAGFPGLGSATTAILGSAALITPPGGILGTVYPFGGGGGTLTVLSPLGDGESPRSLNLAAGNAPLTLALSGTPGSLSYTGGTTSVGAALIFDTTIPLSGNLTLGSSPASPGYIGSTVNSGYSDANTNIETYVNLFTGGENGVIGFDIIGGGTRSVTSSIDVSDISSGIFLGTATAVNFSGTITPDSTYRFAGVKGGQVTVSSNLTAPSAGLVAGLANPIESFNTVTGLESVSSVTLSGNNTYGGGTTLNSGYLYVTNPSSIGTGALVVPDSSTNGWTTILSSSGGPVALSNNIQVPDSGLALNSNSTGLLALTGNITPYGSDAGQLGIFGPVALSGNNTYSGGTTIGATTVTIASDSGLGSGSVTANGSTLTFAGASTVLASVSEGRVSLTDTTATFAGTAFLNDLSMAESTLILAGATATINGLENDAVSSGNSIELGGGTALTINTLNPNNGNNSATYHGVITGISGSSLFVTGGGSLDLRAANTYPGGTVVDNNTIVIASNNAALGTGPVTISSGGAVATNIGVTLTNPIALNSGADLAGFGTFSPGGTLTFSSGSSVDPGRANLSTGNNSQLLPIAGALSFGAGTSVSFAPNGVFIFSVTDASGVAGTGYGTINMGSSALTVSSNAGSPFNIFVVSFDPATNLEGSAVNFNPYSSYSWTLVSAQSIGGFNSTYFNVITANFDNATNGGTFSVGQSGNDLTLNFTPVPEPATWAMLAAGIFALGGAALRRRRR